MAIQLEPRDMMTSTHSVGLVPTLVLSPEEREIVAGVVEELPPFDIFNPTPEILTWAQQAASRLPSRLVSVLLDFRARSNEFGTLLFRDLPIDAVLPPTPQDGRPSSEKGTRVSEGVLLTILSVLGELLCYADEKEGALVQNVIPVQWKEDTQENTGSAYLEFHTEDGFHPYRPDYVALLGLRPDHNHRAETATACIRRVLPKLPNHAIEILRRPLFRIRASTSFGTTWSRTLPILTGHLLDPDMTIDFFLMEPLSPEADWSFRLLKRYLLQETVSVVLEPGDLILVDNALAAHARTGFDARYDGYDRWLQRAFAVRDSRRLQAFRGLGLPTFEPLPIAVEAGE